MGVLGIPGNAKATKKISWWQQANFKVLPKRYFELSAGAAEPLASHTIPGPSSILPQILSEQIHLGPIKHFK